ALTTFGEVYCWGANWSGQLGDGSNTSDYYPKKVILPYSVKEITKQGSDGICVILETDEPYCWGSLGLINFSETESNIAYQDYYSPIKVSNDLVSFYRSNCMITYP